MAYHLYVFLESHFLLCNWPFQLAVSLCPGASGFHYGKYMRLRMVYDLPFLAESDRQNAGHPEMGGVCSILLPLICYCINTEIRIPFYVLNAFMAYSFFKFGFYMKGRLTSGAILSVYKRCAYMLLSFLLLVALVAYNTCGVWTPSSMARMLWSAISRAALVACLL